MNNKIVEFVRKEGSRWVVECRENGKLLEFASRTLPAAMALAERYGFTPSQPVAGNQQRN